MVDVILDPFHRALALLINEQIQTATDRLADGSATTISEDTASVAEKYAAQVAHIRTLRSVLDLCHRIEGENMGARPAQVKVVER